MAEQDSPPADLSSIARIVSSYVRHHRVEPDQLAGLIVEVHQALTSLGRGTPSVQVPPEPAVPIRQSVQRDYVVCLECGFRGRTLRRHLRVQHGLEVAAYRARWKLSPDHAVTAPAYSARRSVMAKERGLGRKPAAVEAPPAPKRRGRPRRPTAN
jgi:predicted transcriptional regulator